MRVKIEGDETVYVVAGNHPGRGLWLTVEEDEYDGYDGDLIVQPDWLNVGQYSVVLADSRSKYQGKSIRLNPA